MNLFPPQKEVVERGLLTTGLNCLLNMATGSGKTYLAEIAIQECLDRNLRAIYLTPLKALADEKYEAWKKQFAGTNVGLFTGDVTRSRRMPCSYQSAQIYIMTPERLDACLRHWRSHWSWIPDIDLLVIDEFHLIGDPGRGPKLEGTITRLLRINPFARILGLSATLSNIDQLTNWLQGVHYSSKWRQVPLSKRIVNYSNHKDKQPLLMDEVTTCIKDGGQSLVFCNSRARAQSIAQTLADNGIKAAHHHAGLDHNDRKKAEQSFRSGEIDVLVATSTLEMGLNLPARQVIIYDSKHFNGAGYTSLPVINFMQRAGRAGRPGLDKKGEVILLMPKWAQGKKRYLYEQCEPIRSGLSSSRAMAEQLLVELFAGYSKTRGDLTGSFLPLTLYQNQHPGANIDKTINNLIAAEMLKLHNDDNQVQLLKPTALGRLAARLMFSPSSVKLIKDIYKVIETPYYFDLLLMAALTEDSGPVLPANYEDIDTLSEIIKAAPSRIMEMPLESVQNASDTCPQTSRLLAGIKMAAICYALVNNYEQEDKLAKALDVYTVDIELLKNSMVRLLAGMAPIIKAVAKNSEEDTVSDKEGLPQVNTPRLCKRLANMVEYEIDANGVVLTCIAGVGGKTAKSLIEYGYTTVEDVALSEQAELSAIPGIGRKLAAKIIEGAQKTVKSCHLFEYTETAAKSVEVNREIISDICPYRLRRSMELRLLGSDGPYYFVVGGREDHIVTRIQGFACDCKDYENRQQDCKHILAVKRTLGDKEVSRAVEQIKENKTLPLRAALPSLWYSLAR